MAARWKGDVVGGNFSQRPSVDSHSSILAVGDDTDSDEPLLDISEAGFAKRIIARNRTKKIVSQPQMEHANENESCTGSSYSVTVSSVTKSDLASSCDNVDPQELRRERLQREQHHSNTLQGSIPEPHTLQGSIPEPHTLQGSIPEPHGTVFLSNNQTQQNPFDFPAVHFNFPTHDLRQMIPRSAHISRNGTGYSQPPHQNDHDLCDPLNFGDPTFVTSYSTPHTVSLQTPAFYTYPTYPPALIEPKPAQPTTQFLDSFSTHSLITPTTYSFSRPAIPNAPKVHIQNLSKSMAYTANPVLEGFDRKAKIDSQFITSPDMSRTVRQEHAQTPPSKAVVSLASGLEQADGHLRNRIDMQDQDHASQNTDVIIKDYIQDVGNTRESNQQLRSVPRFDRHASSKDTIGKGFQHGWLGNKELLTSNENILPKGGRDVSHEYLDGLQLSIGNSGSDVMADGKPVDERVNSRARMLGSNSDNRFVDEDSNLSSRRRDMLPSLDNEGQENTLHVNNMHGNRSHWDQSTEEENLEETALFDSDVLGADRLTTVVSGGTGVTRVSSHHVPQINNKIDRVVNYRVSTDQQHPGYRNVVTEDYSRRDSLRQNVLANNNKTNTRDATDESQAVRCNASRDGRIFVQRNSYGEFSPLPHFLDNSDVGQHESTSFRNSSFRHCHKQNMSSSSDKLARRQLISVVVLCLMFMIGEGVGGALANSLALFTDVLHLGSDLISFIISLLAMWLSNKPATRRMSFGYHRAEVLGALVSVFIIWLVSGVLCYIAVDRILHEHYKDVKPDEMLITASLGVFFNIVMGFVLHSEVCCGHAHSHNKFGHGHSHGSGDHGHSHGVAGHGHSHSPKKDDLLDVAHERRRRETAVTIRREGFDYQRLDHAGDFNPSDHQMMDVNSMTMASTDEDSNSDEDRTCTNEEHLHKQKNINVRAAFIHVVGDIIQSLGVLVAALIIKFTTDERYRLADPICTFLFSLLVLITTITVLRDALLVIMEGVPRDLSIEALRKEMAALDGVVTVHSLHIWALTLDRNALSVHLAVENSTIHDQVLSAATKILQDRHHFYHSTIQVELYDETVMKSCKECTDWN